MIPLSFGTMGWGLSNANVVTIGDLGNYLQSIINWQVNVDSTIASQFAAAGNWSGTVQQVIEGFAATNGIVVSFDTTNHIITFAHQ